MEKAVLYCRVSTHTQDFDRQVKELEDWAVGKYEIVGSYAEKISGAKKVADRPMLSNAIDCAIKEQATIVSWELSRLGRNAGELLKTVLELKEQGVNVFFKKENISIFSDGKENPFFLVMLSTLAVCAELERGNIRERMRSGYTYFRANGGKVGRKVGYRKTIKEYEKDYPALVADLREKAKGVKGKLYSVRALAERHKVNPSTVQSITRILRK
ncbi:MAG: recombinase family protein [Prevotellaceae bacterium]|nr:recombinase family protein [Prevotellaceae bacterium]